ncbi:MAG: InlB B-repeat-containing protein [Lachnospiraceae bacterium]|nr:InlB B-repeat-containing protein [Lachnospiraceae bacterium]
MNKRSYRCWTFVLTIILLFSSFDMPVYAVGETFTPEAISENESEQQIEEDPVCVSMQEIEGGDADYDETEEQEEVELGEIVDSGACGDSLTWYARANGQWDYTLVISGMGRMYDYSENSPAPWHEYRFHITEIIVEDGVESIGKYAFYYILNATSIVIPDTVTEMSAYAIRECISLTNLRIPKGITSLEDYTVYGCSSLRSVFIPSSIVTISGSVAPFYNCSKDTLYYVEASTTPKGWKTRLSGVSDSSISTYHIAYSITEKEYSYWSSLDYDASEITIRDGIINIPDYQFFQWPNLKRIVMSYTVQTVGKENFYKCRKLTDVVFSENLIEIGENAFSECINLVDVDLPSTIERISKNAFTNIGIEKVFLPNSLQSVNSLAFNNCKNLKEITIATDAIRDLFGKSTVEKIVYTDDVTKVRGISNFTALKEVVFGKNITEISMNSKSIEKITLPSKVKTIGSFAGCSSLKEIYIPNGVKTIGQEAFRGCDSLSTVYLPDTVEEIGYLAFGVKEWDGFDYLSYGRYPRIYTSATSTPDKWDRNYHAYKQRQGVDLCRYGVTRDDYDFISKIPINATKIECPRTLKAVPLALFGDYSSLESVYIPKTVQSFKGHCDFTSGDIVFLFESDQQWLDRLTKSVGWNYSYLHGVYVTSLIFNVGDQTGYTYWYDEIEDLDKYVECFEVKQGIATIPDEYFKGNRTIKEIVLPETMECIGRAAFAECVNLKKINIPETVNSIDGGAFDGCTDLEIIGVMGSEAYFFAKRKGYKFTSTGKTECEITFDVNGGKELQTNSKKVIFSEKIGEMPIPLRDNYTFVGWYTDVYRGNRITEDSICEGSMTLYARWEGCKCTVSFDPMGGEGDTSDIVVTYNSYYGNLPVVEKKGYTFVGWYTNKQGGTRVYYSTKVDKTYDHSLYARWTPVSINLTFDANQGVCATASKKVSYDEAVGELPIPSRVGYTFSGWSTSMQGGETIKETDKVEWTSDVTVYATWEAGKYWVEFDTDGGNVLSPKQVTYDQAYGVLETPEKPGYSFTGWYYNGKKVQSSTIVTMAMDHILTASWTPNKYLLMLNANGGSCNIETKDILFNECYGQLPLASRDGYDFEGWFTEADGGSRIESDSVVSKAEDITLYAHWSGKSYTVSFDCSGGICSQKSKTVTFDQEYGSLPTPTKNGYDFQGWYSDVSGGSKVTSATFVKTAKDHSLYARWKGKTVAVLFDANGGSLSETSMNVIYGDVYGTMPIPVRDGYTFLGWYTAVTGGSEVCSSDIVGFADTKTLYAHWEIEIIAVTAISISGSSLSLLVGEDAKLEATVEPENATNKAIEWISEDSRIATVDGTGRVTAVAEGSTEITARTKDGKYSAKCIVTVSQIMADAISLNKAQLELVVGETGELTAVIFPENTTDKTVTWISSDENIARVDEDGLVTAIKPGNARITAETLRGLRKAYCQVSVKGKEVESVVINIEDIELKEGERIFLSASVLPEDATDPGITWVSDDDTVATVSDDGRVEAISAGETVISALAHNDVKGECRVRVLPNSSEVELIILSVSSMELTTGKKGEVAFQIYPEEAVSSNVIWSSSDEKVAVVREGDDKAIIEAISSGSATITVQAENGVKAACEVTVKDLEVTVSFNACGGFVDRESMKVIYGSPYGKLPTATKGGIVFEGWYTAEIGGERIFDNSIVSIDTDHILYAHWGNKENRVIGVSLERNNLVMRVGQEEELRVSIEPEEATGYDLLWTSNDDRIASVVDGKVTAKNLGTTFITVSTEDGAYSDKCQVTVVGGCLLVFVSDGIEYKKLFVDEGTVADKIEPPVGKGTFVGWYSEGVLWDPTVPVYSDMLLTARFVQEGITEGERGENPLDSQSGVYDKTDHLTLVKGQKFVLPDSGWECSAKSYISLNKKGEAKAKKATESPIALVRKVNGNVKQQIWVTILQPSISKSMTIQVGAIEKVSLTGGGNLKCFWTSTNPDVATVDSDGTIHGLSKGNVTITAYINGVAHNCKVKVADVDASKRNFTQNSTISLMPMQSTTIKVNGFKAANAVWSSDLEAVPASRLAKGVAYENAVVRITKKGKITAIGAGTTTLKATGGGVNLSFTIEVSAPVTRIVHLNVNKNKTLKIYGTKGSLNWKSSGTSTLLINGNKITGLKAGVTTLTTTYENLEYKVIVYVEDPLVISSGIHGSYSKYTLDLKVGQTVVLKEKQTYQSVLYKSNKNHIAFVDEAGVLTARSKGKAVITAKVNGVKTTITVNVSD